jgi:hypothetical protein
MMRNGKIRDVQCTPYCDTPRHCRQPILQALICDDLRRGNILNSGNNGREQIWQLFIPRVKERCPAGGVTCPLEAKMKMEGLMLLPSANSVSRTAHMLLH